MAADSPEDPKQMNRALNTPPDFVYPLSDLSGLEVHADRAHPAEFLGRSCLCVENGLVVIGASHSAARIQIDIASPVPRNRLQDHRSL